MAPAPITGLYAALCALIMLAYAARIVRIRWQTRTGLGDGGDRRLARAIRIHANAVEYVPIALILLLIAELNGLTPVLLHLCGITLVLARVAHAIGLLKSAGVSAGRAIGFVGTVGVIGVLAIIDISSMIP